MDVKQNPVSQVVQDFVHPQYHIAKPHISFSVFCGFCPSNVLGSIDLGARTQGKGAQGRAQGSFMRGTDLSGTFGFRLKIFFFETCNALPVNMASD